MEIDDFSVFSDNNIQNNLLSGKSVLYFSLNNKYKNNTISGLKTYGPDEIYDATTIEAFNNKILNYSPNIYIIESDVINDLSQEDYEKLKFDTDKSILLVKEFNENLLLKIIESKIKNVVLNKNYDEEQFENDLKSYMKNIILKYKDEDNFDDEINFNDFNEDGTKNLTISNDYDELKLIYEFQPNMVLYFKNDELSMANAEFLNFFHVKTLEEFNEKHDILKIFSQSENALYSSKDLNWLQKLNQDKSREHKIKILDEKQREYYFILKYNELQFNPEIEEKIVTLTDISNNQEVEEYLKEKSTTDNLTKLNNREFLDKHLKKFFNEKQNFCIAILDIDNFKMVNDTYGHATGDEVLLNIANICLATIRANDVVARWGGEEFIMIFPLPDLQKREIVTDRVRETIENFEFSHQKQVTASFGLTECNVFLEDFNEAFKRADEALYMSKTSGKNKITIL